MSLQLKRNLRFLRVGYVPYSLDFEQPGDKRRFVFYANEREIRFEIANPTQTYDLVVVSQKADLSVWSRYSRRAKVVYDSIDSYLAIPRTSVKGWLRGPAKYLSGQSKYLQLDHWKAVSDMCLRADAVVCSTIEQEGHISRFCKNVHIILDSHSGVLRRVKSNYERHQPFRLVWEGLPQNIYSLKVLSPIFSALNLKYSIELHVISDSSFYRYLGSYRKVDSCSIINKIFSNYIFHEWHEATCADIMCECDLAIIPLNLEDSFASGKPENKLLLCWRMGMPVVTSASPAYLRAMSAAGVDCAVCDESSWEKMLVKLITNKNARENSAFLGKSYADREYSRDRLLAKWDRVFESLGFSVL